MLKFTNTEKTAALFNNMSFSLTSPENWASIGDGPTREAVLAYLSAGNNSLLFDIPVKTFQPLSAWQVRKVLTQFNLRTAVEAGVAAANQNTKDAWAYAKEFQRDDPVLTGMAMALGLTKTQLDSMFDIGITL